MLISIGVQLHGINPFRLNRSFDNNAQGQTQVIKSIFYTTVPLVLYEHVYDIIIETSITYDFSGTTIVEQWE